MLLLAIAAASLSAPEPINYLQWWTSDDMPMDHIQAGVTRDVAWRATVSPTGQTVSCDIDQTSGDPELDALTCKLLMKRARFKPATWIDGSPVVGVLHEATVWAIGNSGGKDLWPITVPLAELPPNAHSPESVRIKFAVHEDGIISDCVAAPFKKKEPLAALVPAACSAVAASPVIRPPLGADGKAVRSVQVAVVTFVKR
jgi:hypothetical protein